MTGPDPQVKAYLADIGRAGGNANTPAQTAARQANARKAAGISAVKRKGRKRVSVQAQPPATIQETGTTAAPKLPARPLPF